MLNKYAFWSMVFVVFSASASAAPQPLLSISHHQSAVICEFAEPTYKIPEFNEPECRTAKLMDVDPQNKALWVSLKFDRPKHWEVLHKPYGLFVFAKASSELYLNGEWLGRNGIPAYDDSEVMGRMDTVFSLPADLVKDKDNMLVMHLSGQHSIVKLGYPVHFIGFAQYGDTRDYVQMLSQYGLILLGAFILGSIYFFILSFGNQTKSIHRLFAALCCLASLQLGTELSRGLIHYSYIWHDIRLITVTFLSFLFGTSLLAYSSYKVAQKHYLHWLYAGMLLTIVAIILAPGFDAKTTAGIFIPLVVSLVQLISYWRRHSDRRILTWFWVQLTIAVTIVISAATFHEIIHFMLVGGLLCYLFVQQARDHREQQQQLSLDQSTIAKLEYKLAENAQSQSPAKLAITVAGTTEMVSTNDIAYCKASGDYVEVHLTQGGETLYSGTLKQLEGLLPATFLKVHRSYLVNLNEVLALTAKHQTEKAENVLRLTNEQYVPVSRRLLPIVKDSLKQAAVNAQ